ncbi:MAG: hypothetical protein PHY08_03030 [Candidatus Cloacimonetes bacterium]|nr:hypothetical protein [Candidatus Cloacimonadota bacterium]
MVQRKLLFIIIVIFALMIPLSLYATDEVNNNLEITDSIYIDNNAVFDSLSIETDSLLTDSTSTVIIDGEDFDDDKKKKEIPAPKYYELLDFCSSELDDKLKLKSEKLDYYIDDFSDSLQNKLSFNSHNFDLLFFDNFLIEDYVISNNVLATHFLKDKLSNYGKITGNQFYHIDYPYNVALTRTYAGLGEYDNNFAHISFRKNHSLSVDNLQIRADFRARDRLYKNYNHKEADGYLNLNYQFNDFILNTNVIMSNRDLLSGDYYTSNIFLTDNDRINDKWEFYQYGLAWKFLKLSYISNDQDIKAMNLDNEFQSKTQSAVLSINVGDSHNNLKANIQKDYIKINNQTEFNQNVFSLQHHNQIADFKFEGNYIGLNNLKDLDISFKSAYSLTNHIDFISKLEYQDKLDKYIDYNVYNSQERLLTGGFVYKRDNFNLCFLSGQKEIYQENIINELSEKVFTLNAYVSTRFAINNYYLNISNEYNYDKIRKSFVLLPEYSNTSDISILLPLKNDNSIALGSKIYLVADVLDERFALRHSEPLVDIYVNIGISKLFNFQVQLNNVVRNTYFGDKTLNDFSFTTHIVWYFIN